MENEAEPKKDKGKEKADDDEMDVDKKKEPESKEEEKKEENKEKEPDVKTVTQEDRDRERRRKKILEEEAQEDIDDPVVKEYDVFFTKQLWDNLYILQYPERPAWRPYDRSTLSDVRWKPKHKKLEMEIKISREEKERHYDTQSEDNIQSFTLKSQSVMPNTNYTLAILHGDQLHLTPIRGFMPMRPSFDRIDREDAEKKKAQEEEAEINAKQSQALIPDLMAAAAASANSNVPQEVNVTVKRRESNKEKSFRVATHEHLVSLEEAEPFNSLVCDDYLYKTNFVKKRKEDEESSTNVGKWMSKLYPHTFQYINWDCSVSEYIDQFVSKPTVVLGVDDAEKKDKDDPIKDKRKAEFAAPVDENTLSFVKNLKTLEERIEKLFANGKVLVFDHLIRLLEVEESRIAHVVDIIVQKQIAGVVKQRFVVKSSLLKLADMPATGSFDHYKNVWEYMMTLWAEHDYIASETLVREAFLTPAQAKTLLSLAGTMVSKKGWELKKPRDQFFFTIADELSLNEEYRTYYDKPEIKVSVVQEMKKTAQKHQESNKILLSKVPNSKASVVEREANVVKDKLRKELVSFLALKFKQKGVCNFAYLKESLIDAQKTVPEFSGGVPEEMMRDVLSSMTISLHNTMIRKSVGIPEVDKYRNVAIKLFSKSLNMKKAMMDEDVQKAGLPPINDRVYTGIMKELAYLPEHKQFYIFKSGNASGK